MTLRLNNELGGGQPPYYNDLFKIHKTESGLYYRPSLSYNNQESFDLSGGTNRLYLIPFVPEEDIDITEIGMYKVSGTFAAVMGVYNNENPQPGHFGRVTTLRVQGATIAAPASGANTSALSSTQLLKDVLYWLAFKSATGAMSVTSAKIDVSRSFDPYYTRGPVTVGSFVNNSNPNSIQQCFYTEATAQGATIVLDADLTSVAITQAIQAPMLFVGPTP